MKVITLNNANSILNNLVMELRDVDIQSDRMRFTSNIETLGMILSYEASKYLNFEKVNFRTPYHVCNAPVIKESPVLYTVLRAGIGMQKGVQRIFPSSECAYFAAKHLHSESPQLKYIDAPMMDGKTLVLSDPILATGKSVEFAIDSIQSFGTPSRIIILSIISTEMSLDLLSKTLPDDTILITCQVDRFDPNVRGTDPGIGDVGDLLYGEKIKMNY